MPGILSSILLPAPRFLIISSPGGAAAFISQPFFGILCHPFIIPWEMPGMAQRKCCMDPLKTRNGGALACPVSSPEAQGHIQSPGPWGEQCPAQPEHSTSRGMFQQGNDSPCLWKTHQFPLENSWLAFPLELSCLPSFTIFHTSFSFFFLLFKWGNVFCPPFMKSFSFYFQF